jgi:hypothetical protein
MTTQKATAPAIEPAEPSTFRKALKQKRFSVGLGITLLLVAFVIIAPYLAPFGENEVAGPTFDNAAGALGTDYLGQDVLSRVMYGGREILFIAALGTLLGMVLGIAIGVVAAYGGGWWEEDQEGVIAVINGDTFTLEKRLDINLDPFDIVVDSKGYIYVASGSGQHTHLNSYDANGTHLSTQWIYQTTYIELAPGEDKIYAVDTVLSPRDMTVYHLSGDGQITGYMDSPYHGDYHLGTKIRVSADGKYVFNSSGYVFTAPSLGFHAELDYEFTDVTFHGESFYLGRNGMLLGYGMGSYERNGALSIHGDVQTMLQNKNDIVILSHFFDDGSTVPVTGVEVVKKSWLAGEKVGGKLEFSGENINESLN